MGPGIPPRATQARVTLLSKLYYQAPHQEPVGPKPVCYEELLDTEEQQYTRQVKIDERWVPIDFGWTAEHGCSFVQIVNDYIVHRRMTPSPDERQADLLHVLEVGKLIEAVSPRSMSGTTGRVTIPPGGHEGYVEPLFLLYVGQPVILSMIGQANYRIRSRFQQGTYSIFCIPAANGG